MILMIDEYTSFIESLDKKTKAEILNLIGNIARLGRAVGMILILLMQRPDTTFLSGEIRNNFLLRVVLGPNGNEIMYIHKLIHIFIDIFIDI